mmetsp:Transcript_4951/g.31735  ORF Transcript_4951/g.31735 Transcript_4951/m.31735 type:complete len:200 (-) Transcript_4951:1329-1928(-)
MASNGSNLAPFCGHARWIRRRQGHGWLPLASRQVAWNLGLRCRLVQGRRARQVRLEVVGRSFLGRHLHLLRPHLPAAFLRPLIRGVSERSFVHALLRRSIPSLPSAPGVRWWVPATSAQASSTTTKGFRLQELEHASTPTRRSRVARCGGRWRDARVYARCATKDPECRTTDGSKTRRSSPKCSRIRRKNTCSRPSWNS